MTNSMEITKQSSGSGRRTFLKQASAVAVGIAVAPAAMASIGTPAAVAAGWRPSGLTAIIWSYEDAHKAMPLQLSFDGVSRTATELELRGALQEYPYLAPHVAMDVLKRVAPELV